MGKQIGKLQLLVVFALVAFAAFSSSFAFQSDELLVDDDDFGLEGAAPPPPPTTPLPSKRRFSDPDFDSKIQFSLEHAFGDSDFSPAGTFSARLKTWNHGGQVHFSHSQPPFPDRVDFRSQLDSAAVHLC